MMRPCRYEDLKKQLLRVSELAEQEDDEKELAQATAAVARLPEPAPSSTWLRWAQLSCSGLVHLL